MLKKEEKNSILEVCPIRNVVARFGNKWSLLVILIIHEKGSVRFGDLSKSIPDVSAKVLSHTLRTLEADALVNREVFPEVPLHVEYQLTDLGKELVPFIVQLTAWADKHREFIVAHRKSYKGKKLITE
ncbi:MAG: helix-turn-helix transcriptional regulator [Bacteroidaceae bacterium]|nr:helix-turn-helix transcriptional regulator [Bacteroidaceae bacterium]